MKLSRLLRPHQLFRREPRPLVLPQGVVITGVVIRDVALQIVDFETSEVIRCVKHELENDDYGFEQIPFAPGDVVIDVGANVGIVSIYLAKRFPKLKILAFEPIPENFVHLKHNLRLNQVRNVYAHNLAVTRDGRDLEMILNTDNTGGATAVLQNMRLPGHANYRVPSISLDSVFKRFRVRRCKLLKVDCEGSEHEILHHASVLERVEYLSAEFHINGHLERQGHSIERLVAHCQQHLQPGRLKYTALRMAE